MNRGRIEQTGTPAEVFERPANAFVMDFLGNVNVFQGRVEHGKAWVEGVEMPLPDFTDSESREAVVYIRPHELAIERSQSPSTLEAKVVHVNPAGSRAKIELWATKAKIALSAELTVERFAELGLKSGDTVHVSPRRVRVFDSEPPPAIAAIPAVAT
jgi:sulfate transport system ATP-binding protein